MLRFVGEKDSSPREARGLLVLFGSWTHVLVVCCTLVVLSLVTCIVCFRVVGAGVFGDFCANLRLIRLWCVVCLASSWNERESLGTILQRSTSVLVSLNWKCIKEHDVPLRVPRWLYTTRCQLKLVVVPCCVVPLGTRRPTSLIAFSSAKKGSNVATGCNALAMEIGDALSNSRAHVRCAYR